MQPQTLESYRLSSQGWTVQAHLVPYADIHSTQKDIQLSHFRRPAGPGSLFELCARPGPVACRLDDGDYACLS
ncbi:hypothetical protein BC567DRAFT_224650 [Phyllosticta citribraziliensis]